VCTSPRPLTHVWIAESDETDPPAGITCVRVADLEEGARAGYWLYKAYKWLTGVTIPVPP
jgi:hypothetical protein